jgi:MFS family permease
VEAQRQRLLHDIRDGLRVVWRDRLIRTLTLYSAATSFAVMMIGSIEVYFLVRTVGLSTVAVGVLFGIASIGSVLGALLAARIRDRLGEIRALVATTVVAGLGLLLMPLTGHGVRLVLFALGLGVASAAIVAFNVVSISMTQRRCPPRMLGRASASSRVIGWSTPPLGALAGGALAGLVGTRVTFLIAGAMFLLCALILARALDGVPTEPITVPAQTSDRDSIASGTGTVWPPS